MRNLKSTSQAELKAAKEQALLMLIRFSLLMLNMSDNLSNEEKTKLYRKIRRRCISLEDHLNTKIPSKWFLNMFRDGPAFYRGMLISAHKDANGWNVSPLKNIDPIQEDVA